MIEHAAARDPAHDAVAQALDACGAGLRRLLIWPQRAALAIGGVALVATMALTATDVVLRNLFATVVPGSLELTGLLTMLVVLAAVGAVELEKNHVQVDLLLRRMPPVLQRPSIAGGLLLALAVITITVVRVGVQAAYLHGNTIVSGVLGIPEWPFVLAAAACLALFSLALLANLADALASVLRLKNGRALAALAGWVVVDTLIVVAMFEPSSLQALLPRDSLGLLCIVLCFVLIFVGVHVAVAMAMAAILGMGLLIHPSAAMTSLGSTAIDVISNETWSVVPLFTWMGLLVVASGFAEALYRAAYRWIGHLPGGLASASTVACAGLSSIVGDTLSGVYSMGSIALPQMRAYGYDAKLATATIACAATIGVMIPPSLAFIVYGMITEVSIGKLFMAGILPGLLFTALLIGLITLRATLNPQLAPRGEISSWRQRLQAGVTTWPILLLMLLVLGGIYAGLVTPNEAAGLGVFGALVIAIAMRRLTVRAFVASIAQTLRLTAAIIIIFLFATAFSRFIAISGLPQQLVEIVVGLNLGTYPLIGAILLFYVVIGMFMNALPALVLTVPLFFPIAVGAGFDPVWFGVLVVIMVELGVVTPPIGVNVFAVAALAKDVPMADIFRGVVPFWLAYLALIGLIVAFPAIALFLPSLMQP